MMPNTQIETGGTTIPTNDNVNNDQQTINAAKKQEEALKLNVQPSNNNNSDTTTNIYNDRLRRELPILKQFVDILLKYSTSFLLLLLLI